MQLKMLGVGLAAAILLDATLIRLVMLPAIMVLLGEKVWWPWRPRRSPTSWSRRRSRRTPCLSSQRLWTWSADRCSRHWDLGTPNASGPDRSITWHLRIPTTLRTGTDRRTTSRRALLGSAGVLVLMAAGLAVRTTVAKPEDRYIAANEKWFHREIEPDGNYHRYDTVRSAVDAADVVLLGHITGARATRTSVGEVPTDLVYYGGYVVRIDDVVLGTLVDAVSESIVVEAFTDDVDLTADAATAAADAPSGRALWMIRSNKAVVAEQIRHLKDVGRYSARVAADYSAAEPFYQPIGITQGVFLQGHHHVESPFDPDPDTRLGGEAATFAKVSELVEPVKASA